MMAARRRRSLLTAALFILLFLGVAARAVYLTLRRGADLARLARRQHRERVDVRPCRGPILDRSGEPLAVSVDARSIYVRPREFAGQEAFAPRLAAALDLPLAAVRRRLAAPSPFVWLRRQVAPRQAEAVMGLGLRGVGARLEGRRYYPHGSLAAHLLGFVGVDSQGLEGIERRYDGLIRGKPEVLEVDRDARGRAMLTAGVPDRVAPRGARLELTIDTAIQDLAERALARGVEAAGAKAGMVVVLDPATGEVLALANVPTFDPNHPDRAPAYARRDRAITDPFEPGSTFKAILAAAAIEEGVISPRDVVFCENGRFVVGRTIVHDAHPHGWLSFAEVIKYSSNIGASKVVERLGRRRFAAYVHAFGFGERTGIDLPGEAAGIVRPVRRWRAIDLATQSFGQGIAVTALQLATAFAAIANRGVLMRPFVVRRIVDPDGRTILQNRPRRRRRVVSARTARVVTGLLRGVVGEGGTGTEARLAGFAVAGKTGTAQKVDAATGRYSPSKWLASFVGFAPAERPRVLVLVVIDEPRAGRYGGVVAAPVFRNIAAGALHHLGVGGEPRSYPHGVQAAGARPPSEPPAAARVAMTRDRVPSFLGLSVREAWSRAAAAGWRVSVRGSGYVAAQQPAPGKPLPGRREISLVLRPGAGARR